MSSGSGCTSFGGALAGKPSSCCFTPGRGGANALPIHAGPTCGRFCTLTASGRPRPTLLKPMSGISCAEATVAVSTVASSQNLFIPCLIRSPSGDTTLHGPGRSVPWARQHRGGRRKNSLAKSAKDAKEEKIPFGRGRRLPLLLSNDPFFLGVLGALGEINLLFARWIPQRPVSPPHGELRWNGALGPIEEQRLTRGRAPRMIGLVPAMSGSLSACSAFLAPRAPRVLTTRGRVTTPTTCSRSKAR